MAAFKQHIMACLLILTSLYVVAAYDGLQVRELEVEKEIVHVLDRKLRGSKKGDGGSKSGSEKQSDVLVQEASVLHGGLEKVAEIKFTKKERLRKSYIFKFRDRAPITNTQQMAFDIAVELGAPPDHIFTQVFQGFSVTLGDVPSDKIKSSLVWSNAVEDIFEDQEMEAFKVDTPNAIRRVQGNLVTDFQTSDDVVAAVLDTGVDLDHPDLNIQECVSFIPGEPTCDDVDGHGTHIAGTIGGRVTGVAPGTIIWGVKVLNREGKGFASGIIAGIDFVLGRARDTRKQVVINMSLGVRAHLTKCDEECSCQNDFLHEAVCRVTNAGIPVVVAAGNKNVDVANFFPANYAEAITVSAMVDTDGEPGGKGRKHFYGADDTIASFSNYGSHIDIAAPGTDVVSTWNNGAYAMSSGTSMACSIVTGAVVLYMSQNTISKGRNGSEQVRKALLDAADSQFSDRGFKGDVDTYQEGLLNALNLLSEHHMVEPTLNVQVFLDKSEYEKEDLGSTVNVLVTDVDKNGVAGLPTTAFTTNVYVEDTLVSHPDINFKETGVSGQYTAFFNISNFARDLQHTIEVNVTDESIGISGLAKSKFVIVKRRKPHVFVSDIRYTEKTIDLDNVLFLEVLVSPKVMGALVEIELFWLQQRRVLAKAETNEAGTASFFLRNPPHGTYSTLVTNIEIAGYQYDPSQNEGDSVFESEPK